MAPAPQNRAHAQMSRRQFLRRAADAPTVEDATLGVTLADNCLAFAGVACRLCDDACPPYAIRFRPKLGGHYHPEIDSEKCTSCMNCLQVCPVGAIQAKEGQSHA